MSLLSSVLNILETGNTHVARISIKLQMLPFVAAEPCKHAVAHENAPVFNVPDKLRLKTNKLHVLDTCNMSSRGRIEMVRLPYAPSIYW